MSERERLTATLDKAGIPEQPLRSLGLAEGNPQDCELLTENVLDRAALRECRKPTIEAFEKREGGVFAADDLREIPPHEVVRPDEAHGVALSSWGAQSESSVTVGETSMNGQGVRSLG
jgi:hypothetical protein